MDRSRNRSLEVVSHDIYFLRALMYEARERLGTMDDPLLVQISQFLDVKLNQHSELMKSHRLKMEEWA